MGLKDALKQRELILALTNEVISPESYTQRVDRLARRLIELDMVNGAIVREEGGKIFNGEPWNPGDLLARICEIKFPSS